MVKLSKNNKDSFNLKAILIGIILVVLFSVNNLNTSTIIPFMLFIGILIGLINNKSKNNAMISSLIISLAGSIISTIIAVVNLYYTESPLYAIATIQSSYIIILLFMIVGATGGTIGYYLYEEIDKKEKNNGY